MSKLIEYDETARRAMEAGVDKLADAVRVTLGPRGRHVVLAKAFGGPTVTNDGVTVAREIDLEDPFENLGAQLVKSVATKTNDVAGDGTTTATVLAQALIKGGLRMVAAGANPIALGVGNRQGRRRGVRGAAGLGHPGVRQGRASRRWQRCRRATQQIGELVGEAMTKVGHDGVVSVEESSTLSTELEFTEGVGFDKGFLSAYFVTDFDSQEAVLEDALILLHQEKISSLPDLLPMLEKVAEAGKPLLIIAEDVEGEALATLVVNSIRKTLKAVAVKAPFFGDRRKAFLEDLAVVTGGQVINPDAGLLLREVGIEVLGSARRVVVSKDDTIIVEGGGSEDAVADRIKQLRAEIEKSDSEWDREKLQERLAKLAGGVAVIKVGAATETALKERKESVEDAVAAAKAAVEEGIVAGGGSALIQAAQGAEEAARVAVRRRGSRRRGVLRGARGAAVLDRHQRRPGRRGRGQQGQRAAGRARAERGHAELRRLGRRRRDRPRQGHPVRGAQRGVGSPDGAHHRDGDCREARRAGGRSRPRSPPPLSERASKRSTPAFRRGCFVLLVASQIGPNARTRSGRDPRSSGRS